MIAGMPTWLLIGCFCVGVMTRIALAADAPATTQTSHNDVIDLSVVHQEIDNFGASDCWTMQKIGVWSEKSKNRIAELLFSTDKGIGLSMWRFNIGGGINHETINNSWRTAETFEVAEGKYDWSHQANERWFARAAKQHGVPYLLGFVNSPPGRMTKNGLTNSGDDHTSSTNLKEGFEKQFARYLCDIVQHFRDADPGDRLMFNYLSPVNEPQIEWARGSQEGNRASNEDIKRILVALHEEIATRKLDVKITAPESNTVPGLWQLDERATRRYGAEYGNYLKVFAGDPAIAPLLDGVLCYHDYSSFSGPNVVAHHQTLGEKRRDYPNIKLWMSEICILNRRRDLRMNMALDVARLIHADIVLSGASAWHWWLAVSNGDYKDGLIYTDWRREGDEESIIESKTLWAMGNFSRFVRPGMRRIELQADNHGFDGLLGSAYADPGSGKLVIVYINSSKDLQTVRWTIRDKADRPARMFMPYITSEAQNLAPMPAISSDAAAEIPPRSVVTFVQK
jgi:O-glycosyl hydrolase